MSNEELFPEDYMKRYYELIDIVESGRKDFEKFYKKGNKSAGVRLRKKMQEVRAFAKEIRFEVQELNQKREDAKNQH